MRRSKILPLLLSLATAGLWLSGEADQPVPLASNLLAAGGEKDPELPRYAKDRMILVNFDGFTPPRNGDADGYPNIYPYNPARKEGGKAIISIEKTDAISGHSLRIRLTEGNFYAQFNPYNYTGNAPYPALRAFARQYAQNHEKWKFNTYNRFRFWIKLPTNVPEHRTDGRANANVGTYVRKISSTDLRSDEDGGGHYYHFLNFPALGEWTQVILNMHPDHRRGNPGSVDPGVLAHPTGEEKYNYFDAMTRFYIQYNPAPKGHPADFFLDEVEFFRQPQDENDKRAYSLTATYRESDNRLVLTWNRDKADDRIQHEVRYAFFDIHAKGWKAAQPAPRGIIKPLGDGPYNNMVYDTKALPLSGRPVVYLAVKPANSPSFSQIVVSLIRKK